MWSMRGYMWAYIRLKLKTELFIALCSEQRNIVPLNRDMHGWSRITHSTDHNNTIFMVRQLQ